MERTIKKYNLDLLDHTKAVGYFEIPYLEPVDYTPKRLMGFNYAMSSKNDNVGIHFFLDDYQFERVWSRPQHYTEILQRFDCVFTPDFSLYADMSVSQMIYNVYRSRLLGQYMQEQSLKVIPTVSWADRLSYQFCFDGLPKQVTVAVSTVGVIKNKDSRKLWSEDFTEMLERLEPKRVLLYGDDIKYPFPATLLKMAGRLSENSTPELDKAKIRKANAEADTAEANALLKAFEVQIRQEEFGTDEDEERIDDLASAVQDGMKGVFGNGDEIET